MRFRKRAKPLMIFAITAFCLIVQSLPIRLMATVSAARAPLGNPLAPTITTFESTCTTMQTTFSLGNTVCAKVSMFDPMVFNARFDWVDPDFIIQQTGPNITSDGQSATFAIPTMGPNAKTGTWRVQVTSNADASVITFMNFTVNGGGGGSPTIMTYEPTCTTMQTSFGLGDTVCAQAMNFDPMVFNARFDWVDPDLIVQQTGPNITANGQSTTFTIPAMGPNAKTGTWRVQITNNSDSSTIVFANFTVGGGGGTPTIATFEQTCMSPQALFTLGDTVCGQVMNFDPMVFNARFDWVDPDLIVQQTGPNITMVGQNTTFMIPAMGPNAKTGTWRVQITNNSDSSVIAFANFTVSDGSCVSITCPGNLGVTSDADQCGAVVNFSPPTADASCGSIICAPPSGSFFPVGETTVTCTSMAGPSCSFTVTVMDAQPPTLECPENVVAVASAPGQTTVIVNFTTPVATDNCPGATVDCMPASGSAFPLGTTTVTCTATDGSGNTASCSFTVTTFDVCIENDSGGNATLLFNSFTGDYVFCCSVLTISGKGTITKKAGEITLQHNTSDRRVLGKVTAQPRKGSGSLQLPPGVTLCTISDRNLTDNACACSP